MDKTYISYVVQSPTGHVHDFAIVELPRHGIAIYADNSTNGVVKWGIEKQGQIAGDEKIVILNYFTINDNLD